MQAFVICLASFIAITVAANLPENQFEEIEATTEEYMPEIETSISIEDEPLTPRLFFTQAFKTVLQTIGTSTLSTWPSCYVTVAAVGANVPLCLSTALTGRKKRESGGGVISESPKVEVNGVVHDFAEFIAASKVKAGKSLEETFAGIELPDANQGIFTANLEDLPGCFKDRSARQGLITVTSTVTSFTFATTTIAQRQIQTLKFTSAAVTDCLPVALLNSNGIGPC